MQEKLSLLRCNTCHNLIEVLETGEGEIVCCNQTMEHLNENIMDENNPHFAHIENISETEKKIYFNHEMTPNHHIDFIEVISNDKKFLKRKFLEINEQPELILKCDCKEGFYVRIYCNIHNVCTTKQ